MVRGEVLGQARADEATCALCGAITVLEVERPASSYADRGRYGVATCPSCGCGQTVPRPSAEELKAFDARSYNYDAHTLVAPEKRWRARRILDLALGRTAPRVLDVGCMYGFLLDEARARAARVVTGVELSAGPAREAAARGHDVFCGTIADFAEQRGDSVIGLYDLVVVQHVLEHVADLQGFLATAHRLLAPGGRLCIAVPNYGARARRVFREAWGWYQVPVHLHHFGAVALAKLLAANGFAVEREAKRGGDSLFVLLTLLQSVGRGPSETTAAPGSLARALVRVASLALRPYYFVGDDEVLVVARREDPTARA
jgi:2-polyprenyl-3-methyl-5-hydroxy-6-metoxy-1,4-benzoquinol methylase